MKFVADGICFSYNSHPVLSDVSFRIESGSMMCVLGVNGAGKSTLLKCLKPHFIPPSRNRAAGWERLISYETDESGPFHWVCAPTPFGFKHECV